MALLVDAPRPIPILEATRFVPTPIDVDLTRARDLFVQDEEKKKKHVSAYELAQDRAVYRELAKHKGEEGYEAARDALNAYIEMQLKTHIGERLHVGISKFHFPIKNGELMAENTGESVLSMMKRGQKYRRTHGKEVDWKREAAEVYGFEETQRVMVDPEIPVGTMMLSFSPQGDILKGSIYKQNFYDVNVKTADGVDVYRFTSGLSRKESQAKIRQHDLRYARDEVPTDAQFLARPIRFDPQTSPFKAPQEVHAYLHKEHVFKNEEEFRDIINICSPMITSLINSLCNNPEAFWDHEAKERILLNAVDELDGKVTNDEMLLNHPKTGGELYVRPWIPTIQDIDRLVRKPVRVVATGCGDSGGSGFGPMYSVAEASGNKGFEGENAMDDPNLCRCGGQEAHFHCPGMKEIEGKMVPCEEVIIVGKNISTCLVCKEGKKC